jgi:drug/metabolite transporter (DMT)-like permease
MSKLANLAAAGTVVLWASAFPAITVGVAGLGPAGLAVARLVVASAALGALALGAALLRVRRTARGVRRPVREVGGAAREVGGAARGVGGAAREVGGAALGVRWPALRDLPLIAVCGLAGMTGYQLLLNAGERVVPAGTASLLVATAPVYSSLLAVVFLGERAGRRRWAGSAVALAGTALIAASHGLGFGVSALVVLAAAVLQAIFHAAQKPLLARYTSFEVTAYAMWAGTVFILPWTGSLVRALFAGPGGAAIGAAVFLGLAPSAAGFVLWAYAMARMDVGRVTLSLYLVPAVAIVISLAWLGQVPGPVELAGGAVALAGVMLARDSRGAGDSGGAGGSRGAGDSGGAGGSRGAGDSGGAGDSRVAAGDEDGGYGQGGGGPGQDDQQGPGGGEQVRRRVQRAYLLGRFQQGEPADPAVPRGRQQARDGGHRDHGDGGGDAARGVPGDGAEGQAEQGAYAQQQAGA